MLGQFSHYTIQIMLLAPVTNVFQYVLRRRDAIQSEYDSTLDELNKRKDEREQVRLSCDFQQCGILTSVDSDEHLQPPFQLRNSK